MAIGMSLYGWMHQGAGGSSERIDTGIILVPQLLQFLTLGVDRTRGELLQQLLLALAEEVELLLGGGQSLAKDGEEGGHSLLDISQCLSGDFEVLVLAETGVALQRDAVADGDILAAD